MSTVYYRIMWGLVFVIVLGFAIRTFINAAIERQAAREDEERRDVLRDRIRQDPGNAGAHEILGDSLWRAGRYEEARVAYTAAVTITGETLASPQAKYRLRMLEQERMEREGTLAKRPLEEICSSCGALNPANSPCCESCYAQMPSRSFAKALRRPDVQRAAREVLAMAAVVFIALQVFAAMPIEVKGCLIISTGAVSLWRMLQAIDGKVG